MYTLLIVSIVDWNVVLFFSSPSMECCLSLVELKVGVFIEKEPLVGGLSKEDTFFSFKKALDVNHLMRFSAPFFDVV